MGSTAYILTCYNLAYIDSRDHKISDDIFNIFMDSVRSIREDDDLKRVVNYNKDTLFIITKISKEEYEYERKRSDRGIRGYEKTKPNITFGRGTH